VPAVVRSTCPGAFNEVSFTVTLLLVALIVPVVLAVRISTWKVCGPSVDLSAVGETVKLPALLVIEKLPLFAEKSAAAVVTCLIVQYSTVELGTLVVLTLKVPLAPSLIDVGIVPNA
jgi:hypothetical protein